MSGGSFNYLSGRAPDEIRELAQQLDEMADALRAYGCYPRAVRRTEGCVALLSVAADEAERLADLWHAVEWHRSGDSGPTAVRAAALALGEPLPPCLHPHRRLCVFAAGVRALVCDDCDDRAPADEPPK